MRTADVQAVLERNGWQVIRESGTHKILRKGATNLPFAYHDKEIGALQVRKLAKRYGVDLNEFFKALPVETRSRVNGEKLKPIEVPVPKEATKPGVTEGPITGDARLLFLPWQSLQVDPEYQRPLNPQWARWLAENWDERSVGVLTASERADGSIWTLEGQHRAAAAVSIGLGEKRVPCIVFRNLTKKDEADIYLGRNTVKQQTTLALYKAKLAAGDVAAMEINRIVSDVYGLGIFTTKSKTHKTVNSVGALFRLHEWGELAAVMQVWNEAWKDGKNGQETLKAPILLGLGAFLRYYGKQVDRERLIAVLRPYSGLELQYMAAGRQNLGSHKKQSWVAVAEAMRQIYNVRLRDNALSPIDLTTNVTAKWGGSKAMALPSGSGWSKK